MAKVTVYTSSPCPYCSRAKALLNARGADISEVEIAWSDGEARAELASRTRHMTMPQIFIGEQFIGGFNELSALDRSGKLAPLLAA